MAIPAPLPDLARRRAAFARMRELFDALARAHAGIDTLSMGMSDDFELAIAEGATMVRVGSALFGASDRRDAHSPLPLAGEGWGEGKRFDLTPNALTLPSPASARGEAIAASARLICLHDSS